jgi:hypothetical protein
MEEVIGHLMRLGLSFNEANNATIELLDFYFKRK